MTGHHAWIDGYISKVKSTDVSMNNTMKSQEEEYHCMDLLELFEGISKHAERNNKNPEKN